MLREFLKDAKQKVDGFIHSFDDAGVEGGPFAESPDPNELLEAQSTIGHLATNVDRARAEISRIEEELAQEIQKRDKAYEERNRVVAALASLAIHCDFPAWRGLHDPKDSSWDADWRNIVFIQLPTGQVSWHFHDSQFSLIEHLPTEPTGPRRPESGEWDGHTTEEKYARLQKLVARLIELKAK